MKNKSFHFLKYFLLTYLAVTVVFPLLALLFTVGWSDIVEVFTSARFFPMLKNSLVTTIAATVISVALAFALALAINRSNIKFKSVFVVLFTLPMLIPSISHGMGLVLLLGDNGILTNLLGVNIGLYGYKGIIMGSVMYSFPVAFLMFNDSLRYEDYTIYEAGKVLGMSKWNQFTTITMPTMKRTIVSAVLTVFTLIFTDYGVPLMTGGTVMTLPVYMYREVIGMMNFSGGAVVGMVLLLPTAAAFLIDLKRNSGTANSGTVSQPYKIDENKKRDTLVYIAFAIIVVLMCLPIAAFICLSFVRLYPIDMSLSLEPIKKLFANKIGIYFINSLAVAMLTALIGTACSYFSAYVVVRNHKKTFITKVAHILSMLPLAIPGVVLGLSFLLTFQKLPLYGTIFILVMVNIVHFYSSPYLLAYNSLSKFNSNLEDVARTLGISKIHMLLSVYIPSTMSTIVEMYSYFFVNSMITISAVSFLINFRTMPLALLIPQLESQSFIEGTALVSLLILVINIVEKGVAFMFRRHMEETVE